MFNQSELKQRLIIIKHSDLDDATILDENYKHLMRAATSPEDEQQFDILRHIVKRRIQHLTGTQLDNDQHCKTDLRRMEFEDSNKL
jgi:hypothetical protein